MTDLDTQELEAVPPRVPDIVGAPSEDSVLAGEFAVRYTVTRRAAFRAVRPYGDHGASGDACDLASSGHDLMAEVTVEGQPKRDGPERGMVIELGEIGRALGSLVDRLDGANLVEVLPDVWQPPTLEHLAGWLLNSLRVCGVPACGVTVHDAVGNRATAHSRYAA